MRAVFMGTPDFSVPVLSAMIEDGIEIIAVVTQPDRPKGRGKELAFSPVKEEALRHGLTVWQPAKVRDPAFVEQLWAAAPDVIVVVAFGQILPKAVLEVPKYGCVNVHASLLPLYRGAAPLQYAILDGRRETGVTTMLMDEGTDTGDILMQKKVTIARDETGGSLFDKLSFVGAQLLVETLQYLQDGTIQRKPQTGTPNYVGMIKKTMGRLDWEDSAVNLERKIRAMDPWPSAYTFRNRKMLKIWKAEVLKGGAGEPGEVVRIGKDGFDVQTGSGILRILEVQPEGKKRMDSAAYLRGYPMESGESLDN